MEDHSNEILIAVREIRDLIQLIAEPAIAARDKKFRDQLRKIVGNSKPKAKAVLPMNGSPHAGGYPSRKWNAKE